MARSGRGTRPVQTRRLGVGVGLGLAALVALALAALWIWARPPAPPAVPPGGDPSARLVVFLGDSITRGHTLPPEQAFPHLVGQALGVPVRNAGVNGDTTAGALARLEPDVLAWRPRVVVVELGANDFFRRRPVAETLGNLEAIVRRIREHGAAVVMIHIRLGLLADPYLEGYRELARREGAVLVEDFLGEIPRTAGLTLDGLHPSAEGHRRLADRLLPVLSRLGASEGGSAPLPSPAVGRSAVSLPREPLREPKPPPKSAG